MQGWMCSPGHRANIMTDGYNELGTGLEGKYYTQDFGRRDGVEHRVIAMGLHFPETPDTVTFLADVYNPTGRPDSVEAVLNGEPHDMLLKWGDPDLGVYSTEIALNSEGCHAYYFRAIVGDVEHRVPETGSYTWGECDFEVDHSNWMPMQWLNTSDGKAKLKFAGCNVAAVAPAGSLGFMTLGWALWVVARRRA